MGKQLHSNPHFTTAVLHVTCRTYLVGEPWCGVALYQLPVGESDSSMSIMFRIRYFLYPLSGGFVAKSHPGNLFVSNRFFIKPIRFTFIIVLNT